MTVSCRMAIRVRGINALLLLVMLVFVSVNMLGLLEDARDNALAQSLRSGGQDFRDQSESESEQIASLELLAMETAVVKTPNVEQVVDRLWEELKKTTRPQSHDESKTPPIYSSAATQSTSPKAAKPSNDVRLLIGVMSPFWSSAKRQIIRNGYNQFPKDLPVDIVFVEGDMINNNPDNYDKVLEMQRTVVKWENETYGDIMHVDCVENMENGKTYEYLSKVGREFSDVYTHVMKSDDDSFINIPGSTSPPQNWALMDPLCSKSNGQHWWKY
jgi:hypothetical protein